MLRGDTSTIMEEATQTNSKLTSVSGKSFERMEWEESLSMIIESNLHFCPSGFLHFTMAIQLKTSSTKLSRTTCIYIDKTSNRCEPLEALRDAHLDRWQILLDISYAPAFQSSAVPVTLKNLAFERCGVLFNLAAMYSQLAEKEDRHTKERIKKARVYYQVRQLLRRFCISV
jgi:hypothetical protein